MNSDHNDRESLESVKEKLERLEYLRKHLLETIPNSYGRVKADLERVLRTVEEELRDLRDTK